MNCMPRNAAMKRYLARFAVAMGLYLVFLFMTVHMVRHGHPTGLLLWGLAILPALPLLAVLVTMGMYLREETDEFERMVVTESLLWAMGGMMGLTSVWGFLEMFVSVPHLQPFWLFPLFWVLQGLSTPFIRLRYR
jgi:hypothetical protein